MIKAASEAVRRIPAATMKVIAKNLRMDGFKMSPEMMGKKFTVTDVITNTFNDLPTFSVVLQNDDMTVNMSAGILKACRVMGEDTVAVKEEDQYDSNHNIFLRSKKTANKIWAGSKYLHTQHKMDTDKDWMVPKELTIEFGILREDISSPGKSVINSFLYDGFKTVVDALKRFPSWEEFKSELKKSGPDKIPGLPTKTEPEVYDYVDQKDVANMGFTLVLKDVKNEDE